MMNKDYIDNYRGKKILITGGAGAIGSNLTRKLAEVGAGIVIILDDLSSSGKWNIPSHSNVLFVEGSVLDEILLKRVFFEKPDYVFNLAAFFANQNSVDHPERDLMVNGMGTLKMLEYSSLVGVKRFIYASSGCSIYGSNNPLPSIEDFMSMNLSSPYQITKMLGELYTNFFYNNYGLPIVNTRLFNSYGPGEIPGQYRNVIPNFIYWAKKGYSLPITGNGDETRDFTYVEDIVDGLLRAGFYKEAIGESINIAAGSEVRIIDLANLINKITGNKAKIIYTNRRKWDTKDRILASIDKAKKLISYSPKMNFEEGIEKTVKWFDDNWDNIEKSVSFKPGMSSALRNVKIQS